MNPHQTKTVINHQQSGNGFFLAQFKTAQLAILSYYIESQNEAFLIDPTIDVYAYQSLLATRGSKLTKILLTHYHADYLAGHCEFDIPIVMGPESTKAGSTLKIQELKDGEVIKLGSVTLKVIHTPGHTLQSSTFILYDKIGTQYGAFTGDTLFLGEVGRPDLAVNPNGHSKEDLAKMLFHSLSKLKKEVTKEAKIFPAHGAGSFCGKNIGAGNFCNMKTQCQINYALKIENESQFVKVVLQGIQNPPSYFFHDAKINQDGCPKFKPTQTKTQIPFNQQQFLEHMKKGALVIDTRNQNTESCIKCSYLLPEKASLPNLVGTIIDPKMPILLFCDAGRQLDISQRFIRIGYFNIIGYNHFTIEDWKKKGYQCQQPKIVLIKDIAGKEKINILDVRNPLQWKQTGIVENAKTISLKDIQLRFQQLKQLDNLYVHCLSGMRARLGASILRKNGISCSIIGDKFQSFAQNGFKIVPY